jgi:hypothetical protein
MLSSDDYEFGAIDSWGLKLSCIKVKFCVYLYFLVCD